MNAGRSVAIGAAGALLVLACIDLRWRYKKAGGWTGVQRLLYLRPPQYDWKAFVNRRIPRSEWPEWRSLAP